uniref:threonine--tRNA ligase n=1 Tax=Neobodo designis TaxID=312471 RepID=A0A7S1LX93_NEODS|eukprot:CAMPEP_0174828730 /NCGR_PEP_ID=MMETSP1114-20130205/1502_1 /TAXON_ID=312471 /ORGANISM="Neobodo designis, Strain CCAP 1951/1" /LENGTH=813 /DNA_ID=CAMNT_0016062455 /DNA_START=178 /DNA_END=2619 /DNA_ORIENTATION=+
MAEKKGNKKAAPVDLKALQTPEFWASRMDIFDKLYAKQQETYAARKQPIKVTLPDGKVMDAESWVTTPFDIAKRISNSLPDKCIVARINENTLWDMTRPIEGDCTLELLDWDYPEAREVFWHSSAHVLGYAMERVFQCTLSYGPPLQDGGFFYEGRTTRPVSEADYVAVETAMGELVKQKAPFQRLEIQKEDALEMFGYNDFKQITLGKKVPEGGICTVYRCGTLIDPCRGPHIADTGKVKAYCVHKNSSAYFQGNSENEVLQRVYAIAFPKVDLLKEWKAVQEAASKRDHRNLGRQQDLFYFHDVSPGSAFFFPAGARIYNALMDFQKKNYRKRGFDEVMSPNMYNAKLWEVSGHWALYKDAMFTTVCEHEQFGLKPMNCPGHCVLYAARQHSYRELPIRYADFGTLHRNELSGALSGLTRVRRFQQDDAHIFCRMDQLKQEMDGALDFLKYVYGVLGFNFYLKLSTRPENALGNKETWDVAEKCLAESLNGFCNIPVGQADPLSKEEGALFTFDGTVADIKKLKRLSDKLKKEGADAVGGWSGLTHEAWELNPGDGAFYGPKIDIVVEDALRRRHQCATIQLDFQLPERFGLKFTLPRAKDEDGAAAADEQPAKVEEKKEAPKEEPKEKHEDPASGTTSKSASPTTHDHKHGAPPPPAPAKKELHFAIDRHLEPNQERPVMIHRAIFGSLERCIAILCEHYGGRWPFWLSPRQAIVVPVSHKFNDYANEVKNEIFGEGFWCDVDLGGSTLDKKIREAQLAQYNFILVVGEDEMVKKSVNVRTRDNERRGVKTLDEIVAWFQQLARTYSREF